MPVLLELTLLLQWRSCQLQSAHKEERKLAYSYRPYCIYTEIPAYWMMILPKGPSPCHSSPLPAEEHIHSLHIHPHAIDHSLQHLKDKEWKEGPEVIASEGKLPLNRPESSNQTKLNGYKKWPRRLANSVLRLCSCQPSRKKLSVSNQTIAFV